LKCFLFYLEPYLQILRITYRLVLDKGYTNYIDGGMIHANITHHMAGDRH
jgi:hypothetical protein